MEKNIINNFLNKNAIDIKNNELLETVKNNFKNIYSAFEKMSEDYVFIGDIKTKTFSFSRPFAKKLGLSTKDYEDPYSFWKNIIDTKDWKKFNLSLSGLLNGEYDYNTIEFRIKDSKGKNIWLRHKGNIIRDENNEPSIFVGLITVLGKQNKIDNVTGLFKITEFFENFNEKLKDDNIKHLGMMIIGVDNFKHINQMYSRQYGDRVLRMISHIIQYVLPEDMYLYKLDGDNFGIILEDTTKEEAREIYLNIKNSLKKIQILKEKDIIINISAGCTIFSREKTTYQELYKFTMYSLMHSKKSGKDKIVFFSEDVMSDKIKKFEMFYYLKQSIENDFEGFEIFYQPQFSVRDEKLTGFEALLRWRCEKYGAISPLEFIPLLEETSMIIKVGRWVFEKTLIFFKDWLTKYPDLKISLNLSCVQLKNKDCILDFKKLIEETNFPVKNLIFEITESNTIKNIEVLKNFCKEIHNLGIGIALDDFGTGYSSFGVLKEIIVDIVKIDRSFTKNMLTNPFDMSFIKFIIEICRQYNIKLCIEGIENINELNATKELGIDYLQGFYFGKPESKKVITEKYYK